MLPQTNNVAGKDTETHKKEIKKSLIERWNRHDLPICLGLARMKNKETCLNTTSDSFGVGPLDDKLSERPV